MTPTRLRILAPKKLLPTIILRKTTFASNKWPATCCACEARVRPETGAMVEASYGQGLAQAYQTICRPCAEKWVNGTRALDRSRKKIA